MNQIDLIGNRHGRQIVNCIEKLRHFILYDAFHNYDRVGWHLGNNRNQFETRCLTAMNSAMMARSPKAVWAQFLNCTLPQLDSISSTVDLIECDDQAYASLRQNLCAYYNWITRTPYITDMAASKMLHLKRPRSAVISDSYVRSAMSIPEPDSKAYIKREEFFSRRVISLSDQIRELGIANIEVLGRLQHELEPVSEFRVSKVRIIDILIWVDMAIQNGHPMWSLVRKTMKWGNPAFVY